jgi:signal transduction histidine kinase
MIRKGEFKLDKTHFDLNDVCEDVFSLLEFEMKSKRLKKKIEIDESLKKLLVFSDYNRILQVLLNLLSNAFKFTNEGSLTIRIQDVTPISESFGSVKRITFKTIDTGIGIQHEE